MSTTLRERLNEVELSPELEAKISKLIADAPRKQGAVADFWIEVPLPGARIPDESNEVWTQTEPMD
jgi:hypothetical protein